MSSHEDHLEQAWTNNPFLNIDKSIELRKLRREVPLKLIFISEIAGANTKRRTGSDLQCSQPILGKWINDCDFPFLMETLALPDSVFHQEFPGIRLTHRERKIFANTLKAHCKECARCGAKRAEDVSLITLPEPGVEWCWSAASD